MSEFRLTYERPECDVATILSEGLVAYSYTGDGEPGTGGFDAV